MKLRICVLTIAVATGLSGAHKAVKRVSRAAEVLNEVMGTPEKAVPSDLLSRAHCVAIIPGVKKIGLGLGGKYGKGVITCRGPGGNGWTGPSTVRIHYCPVKSRIESAGWGHRVSFRGSRTAARPVKWAFSRKG